MANETTTVEVNEDVTAPAAEQNEAQPDNDTEDVGQQAEASPEPVAASGRDEAKRFHDAFGSEGAVWYAEGLSFEQARTRRDEQRDSRIDELEKKLSARPAEGEQEPIDFDSADEDPKRKGFASKINIK